MTIRPFIDTILRVIAWLWHHLVLVTSVAIFLVAVVVIGLRYWVLPNIGDYREHIAQWMSKSAGQKVTIGELTADWEGLRPRLNLGDVRVYDQSGRAALMLKRVDSTVSWRSLAMLRPAFRSIDIYEPALDIRRNKAGVISVAGIEMGGESGAGGFSDWALGQRDIEIHKAAIDWTDEMRDAPTLQLRGVFARLVNRGERHRFAIKAHVPAYLAGPLDLRADLTGKSIKNLADWNGRMYVDVDQVDIAAWRTWAPFPFEISHGEGALRAWVVIRDLKLREMIADVRLAKVRARPNRDMPELDISALDGRVVWKRNGPNLEVSTTQLGLTTAGDLRLPPLTLRYKATLDTITGKATAGDVIADVLDLAPVVRLADHLPMEAEMRKRLEALAPRGRLVDVRVHWEGALPTPTSYGARARFEDVTVNALNALPGVQGLSGSIEATHKGGSLQLNSKSAKIEMPRLFKAPLDCDRFDGQATWTHGDKGYQIKLNHVAFANADLEGTVNGTYQSVPDGPGIADITGQLTRADAGKVMRYMPLPVAQGARPWMEAAFVAGSSNDVKFKVKGNLYDFPFDGDKNGTFFVTAKVKDGMLHYGDGWPDITAIEGEFAFLGKRMDIVAREGTIMGVRLSGVKADIADLANARVLIVSGDADGQTPQFLQFIAASPVSGYIDHFTDGMHAEGPGKLKLRLELPLPSLDKTRVAGTFQMTGNKLTIEPSMPPLEQATGSIEFTEASVSIPSATGTFFGGPLAVSGGTQRDGTISLALKGRADAEMVRRAGSTAWLNQLHGAADWQGAVTVRKKTVDLAIDSTLQGVSSTLPAPLTKAATETVPLRLERRYVSQDRDQIALTYGSVLSVRLNRHSDGKRTVIDRGVVRLGGGTAGEPVRDGVVVSGALKTLNLDEWLKFSGAGGATASSAGSDVVFRLVGLDVKLGEFELYDRKFGELSLAATSASNADTMRYRLAGRDIEGIVDWTPQGRGRVVAQLQKLTIPATTDSRPVAAREKRAGSEPQQLPALDVVAEQFQLGTKPLGKLELRATQQDRDWRIEQLKLSHADGILTVTGVWQSWLTQPRTDVNVQWGILDIGSTLGRLGYPDAVRRGTAELGGTLSWDGNPYQIDYPSLSGKFALRAANGQFAKMEPGLAKLLGIISLQSIPRRLRLDFRDVFTEGFAFDEILGEVKINRGIITSDKFLVGGPAAKVLMGGTVDLVHETQDLQMKVSPQVSEGVAIATAFIGGPIAALATYIAQKLLKDPLGEVIAFRYNVTGTWADPVVTRVQTPAVAEQTLQ